MFEKIRQWFAYLSKARGVKVEGRIGLVMAEKPVTPPPFLDFEEAERRPPAIEPVTVHNIPPKGWDSVDTSVED